MKTKRFIIPILFFVSIFSACEKTNLTEENPTNPEEGTDINSDSSTYLSVADAQHYVLNQGDTIAIVRGYIVGSTQISIKNAAFKGEQQYETNILIADSTQVSSYTSCLPIQLSKSSTIDKKYRSDLNLVDNPTNIERCIYILGSLSEYYRVPGIKKIYTYKWSNEKDSTNRTSTSSFPNINRDSNIELIGR